MLSHSRIVFQREYWWNVCKGMWIPFSYSSVRMLSKDLRSISLLLQLGLWNMELRLGTRCKGGEDLNLVWKNNCAFFKVWCNVKCVCTVCPLEQLSSSQCHALKCVVQSAPGMAFGYKGNFGCFRIILCS